MSLIPTAVWNNYKSIIRKAHDTFNQDTITWVRGASVILSNNEQEEPSGDAVELKALISFNTFRTWPITRHDNAGGLDNQNCVLILNREYLSELGHLTTQGYFNFKPELDYFIHRGIKYKAEGDTFTSQAYDDPLLIYIVLHREEILAGDNKFEATVDLTAIEEIDVDNLYLISYDVL